MTFRNFTAAGRTVACQIQKEGPREFVARGALFAKGGREFTNLDALGLLAELEAVSGAVDQALATFAQALAISSEQGLSYSRSVFHRSCGDALATRDAAAAEADYRKSLNIARAQGARSLELQAALALAKLLRSTGRPVDALDALEPALRGFSPTPEMPEIAEGQALMATLAVKGGDA